MDEERKPLFANPEIASALDKLLQYNWEAELQDYIDNGYPNEHIFVVLVKLDQWLFGHETTPKEFVRDSGWVEEGD